MPSDRRVSPRDVWTVVWVLLLSYVALYLLYESRRIILWVLIAAFFAVALSPLVDLLVRRGFRRGLAVAAVVTTVLLVLGFLTYAFARPLVEQSVRFAENLPQTIEEVRQAPVVSRFVERFNIQDRVEEVAPDLPQRLLGMSGPVLDAFKTAGGVLIALLTILVLMVFLLLYGPRFIDNAMEQIRDDGRRQRAANLGRLSKQVISGWVGGNVGTSVIAAIVSIIVFLLVGLPYGALLALWVGVADLIPLVGASLGAIPAIVVAFLDSTTTGIIVVVFFIAYQQLENHVIQPAVYGRTIQVNPFLVLVAALLGAELAGFLGALFALPVAGVAQVVLGDALARRGGRERAPDATV